MRSELSCVTKSATKQCSNMNGTRCGTTLNAGAWTHLHLGLHHSQFLLGRRNGAHPSPRQSARRSSPIVQQLPSSMRYSGTLDWWPKLGCDVGFGEFGTRRVSVWVNACLDRKPPSRHLVGWVDAGPAKQEIQPSWSCVRHHCTASGSSLSW